ncbi:glycoside hydrolase family 48 protein [Streptomyces sp. enrichment culture]|uniref:glycoside hydrolase family 48 protein n=1 Tax=Streptomyces sp. enrichment culture TaxID=1795815 RepID=UPI003F5777DF
MHPGRRRGRRAARWLLSGPPTRSPVAPPSSAADRSKSPGRQVEFCHRLRSGEDAVLGSPAGSRAGRAAPPPAGKPAFHGTYRDERPVHRDPPPGRRPRPA